jgi:hypothetical protein
MSNLFNNVRYALRQFRLAPIFTVAAVLTLALGIGGTTAIFTLIHAIMLRSLPVSDPARLYRVGTGDNCCVQGGPQDEWGMFSYPLIERLATQMPEFEEFTAFQAGRSRLSVRRQGVESTARPLRSEYVTGHYFSTLGVGAFGGRVLTPDDDQASAPPVAVLSHRAWQTTYGGDTSVVGSTFLIEGHPFTIVGVAPPGFFGEMLESDPPDMWLPLQQDITLTGESSLVRQPISAWLRIIGRLKPGATTAGMTPRLTGVLRQWLEHDSGYPANWMADVVRILPKQTLAVIPAGLGRHDDEGGIRPLAHDLAFGVRTCPADCVRERCEPTTGAFGGASRANRRAPRDRRYAAPGHFRSADREHGARDLRRNRRSVGCHGRGEAASISDFP